MSPRSYKALQKKKKEVYSLNKPTYKVPVKFKQQFHLKEIEAMKAQFEAFDASGDGSIDADELGQIFEALGQHADADTIEEMIREVDVNNSRAIEFDEFVTLLANMRHGQGSKLGRAMIEGNHDARIAGELNEINGRPVKYIMLSNVKVEPHEDRQWAVEIDGPENSPYEGGIFHIEIKFPETYPYEPPVMHFKTRIYHINFPQMVLGHCSCRQVLHAWDPSFRIRSTLELMSALMEKPDLELAKRSQKMQHDECKTAAALPRCEQHHDSIIKMYEQDFIRFGYYVEEMTKKFAWPEAAPEEKLVEDVIVVNPPRVMTFGLLQAPKDICIVKPLDTNFLYFFPIKVKQFCTLQSVHMRVAAGEGKVRFALYEETRKLRSKAARQMEKSKIFGFKKVVNTDMVTAEVAEDTTASFASQQILLQKNREYFIGLTMTDALDVECSSIISGVPHMLYNFEFYCPDKDWKEVVWEEARMHPFPFEDCQRWCVAIKTHAIPPECIADECEAKTRNADGYCGKHRREAIKAKQALADLHAQELLEAAADKDRKASVARIQAGGRAAGGQDGARNVGMTAGRPMPAMQLGNQEGNSGA
jgi:ubiquitin-conjugating enzyme E2 N